MARKNVLHSFKMIDAGDISGNVTSTTTNVAYLDKASIAITWTGTSPVGTITVSARNGENDAWRVLDFGSTISVSGNSGSHEIIMTEMPFTDIKMDYTAGSGTGSLTATLTSKTVGA